MKLTAAGLSRIFTWFPFNPSAWLRPGNKALREYNLFLVEKFGNAVKKYLSRDVERSAFSLL